METQNLKGIPLPRLEAKLEELGHSRYRGQQLFQWIHQKRARGFEEMTNLSKKFRAELAEKFALPTLKVHSRQESEDGTIKFLVELEDGNHVESVFIPMKGRNTLCVSTQVGCKMACSFCATGYQRFTRNLKAWEIVEQLIGLEFPEPVTNMVFMGMGEPFDNFDAVMDALRILQDPMGPQIGKRHITVSTVGLSDRIPEFIQANVGRLAISLHGTTDEQRSKIMPVNRKFNLETLLGTCRDLGLKGSMRITWEYLLIRDHNDSDEDAHRLAKILRDIPSKINLLAYNENPFVDFRRPTEKRVLAFQKILMDHGYVATYRRSRGRDIAGACGQLRTQEERALKTAEIRRQRA